MNNTMTFLEVAEKCLKKFEAESQSRNPELAKRAVLNYINSLVDEKENPINRQAKEDIIQNIRHFLNSKQKLILEEKAITQFLELVTYLEDAIEGL